MRMEKDWWIGRKCKSYSCNLKPSYASVRQRLIRLILISSLSDRLFYDISYILLIR